MKKAIKNLKILTLVENMVGGKGWGSWGLSLFLEFKDIEGIERKILFDTGGAREIFNHNVETFKVNLSDLDAIVISHGHWDHTAALVEALEYSNGTKVFCHPDVFLPRFVINKEGKKREIGVPEGQGLAKIEEAGGKVIFSIQPVEIVPGLWTTGEVQRLTFEKPMELDPGSKLIKVSEGVEMEDNILDDQSLWIDVESFGPIILTGCGHAGLLNIITQVKKLGNFKNINGIIGGTHLVGRKKDYMDKTIKELKKYDFKLFSPCHCTGFKAIAQLYNSFPKEFYLNYSGREFNINELSGRQVF